jgi:hypothetical protein
MFIDKTFVRSYGRIFLCKETNYYSIHIQGSNLKRIIKFYFLYADKIHLLAKHKNYFGLRIYNAKKVI